MLSKQERPLGQGKTPPRQQTPFGDIEVKALVKLSYWQIYVYNTDFLSLKI